MFACLFAQVPTETVSPHRVWCSRAPQRFVSGCFQLVCLFLSGRGANPRDFFRVAAVISVRHSPSLAVPNIMRPLGVHFTNCIISSQILAVLSGVGLWAVHFSFLSSRHASQALLEFGDDEWCQLSHRCYRDVVKVRPVFYLGREPDLLLSHLVFEFRQHHPQPEQKPLAPRMSLAENHLSPQLASCLSACSPKLLVALFSFPARRLAKILPSTEHHRLAPSTPSPPSRSAKPVLDVARDEDFGCQRPFFACIFKLV